jgi:hypothetical protein
MAANRVSVNSGNTLSMPIGTTKYSITSQTCKKGGIISTCSKLTVDKIVLIQYYLSSKLNP